MNLSPPAVTFLMNMSITAVFVHGSTLCIDGKISIGVMMAFIVYLNFFIGAISSLASSITSLQVLTASSDRIFRLLDQKEVEDESGFEPVEGKVRGSVELRNITFGYKDGPDLIKNLSLKVEAGQKVAIVGPTGAGKTTFANIVSRYYDVRSGTIIIDGRDASTMSVKDVNDMFSVVLQEPWLFKGTLKDNLIYNTEGVSQERLEEVCSSVGLDHIVERLPDGYDTKIDSAVTLSESEKQLICVCRAIIRDSPIIILDEATSSMDVINEIRVQKAMSSLIRGKTSFVIAHRLSTIIDSDIILYMEHGDVLEKGTHKELMQQGGKYRTLFMSQFANEESE